MNGKYSNIKVSGIASAVPSYVMDNMDYIDVFGKRQVMKQAKLTGIYRHHLSYRYQKLSDLCVSAAEKLLEHLQWNREEVKVLILCTQFADYEIPSTAIDLAERLGMGKDCMAYDINLGCSAFDLGIQTIGGLLQSQPDGTKALLLTGDIAILPDSVTMKREDIINIMMFGSGGAATALEKQPENEFSFRNFSDGSGWDAIVRYRKTEMMMQGNKVFEFALNDVATNMSAFLRDLNIEENVDFYVLHQAQKLILDTVTDVCGLPEDKVITSFEEYGNTSSASIPITLCHNRDKYDGKENIQICSCGFGVGLSMGISYFQVPVENILPVIVTDEHFDEHRLHYGEIYTRNVLIMEPKTAIDKFIGRELDSSGCNLGFYGSHEIVEEMQSQLFWKDCELFVDKLDSVAESSSKKYDAVIFDMTIYDEEKVAESAQCLVEQGALSTNSSIVLVAEEEESDETLQSFMSSLSALLQGEYRVNAVVYKAESFDLFPKIFDSPEWLERKISLEDSSDMERPFYLAQAVEKLVSLKFLAVSSTIIHISDSIKEFL